MSMVVIETLTWQLTVSILAHVALADMAKQYNYYFTPYYLPNFQLCHLLWKPTGPFSFLLPHPSSTTVMHFHIADPISLLQHAPVLRPYKLMQTARNKSRNILGIEECKHNSHTMPCWEESRSSNDRSQNHKSRSQNHKSSRRGMDNAFSWLDIILETICLYFSLLFTFVPFLLLFRTTILWFVSNSGTYSTIKHQGINIFK